MSAPKPRLTGAKRFFAVAACILCLLSAGALVYLAGAEWRDRRAGEGFYAGLAGQAAGGEAQAKGESQGEGELQAKGKPQDKGAQTPPPSAVDFQALRRRYGDVVGWLRLADSPVDYPVVQGRDNAYYLDHLPDGTPNAAGSIMMDQANSPDFADQVTILHGHHMASGAMYGSLEEYAREDYYRRHPTMELFTPQGDYRVRVFAAYTVDGASFAYPTGFGGEREFSDFIRRAQAATPYDTGVTPGSADRLLLLSTCAYDYRNARFVVLSRLEPVA